MIIALVILITISYALLIGAFRYGFKALDTFEKTTPESEISLSIIIPFRNEAEQLPQLIDSLNNLKYKPENFEIIFVNDASTDTSVECINSLLKLDNYTIIANNRQTNSPKKDAITTAITSVKNEWIITTDADCFVPEFWLQTISNFITQHNYQCIAAPVIFRANEGGLQQFQMLDFISLIGSSIGAFGIGRPFMCNGANFMYTKSLFYNLEGFKGNAHIASGDDMFLLEKALHQTPEQVGYLKSTAATVVSKPQPSVSQLVSQRLRWAAKTSAYTNRFGILTAWLVFLQNLILVVLSISCVLGFTNYKMGILIWITKIIIDVLLIIPSANFFKLKWSWLQLLWVSILYPFFTVYIAFRSMFTTYEWKGRTYKK